MNPFNLKFFFTLMFFALTTHSAIAEVKAYLNQSSFFEGDPVTLNLESTTNNNAKPNLTPLQKDFTILGTSTNSQISIMNGRRSFKKSWIIELQAKNKGDLTIPEIAIGNEKTQAVDLLISDLPPEITTETSKHIFIESSIGTENDSTYVQQQLPYTIKLFYDTSMQTAQIQTPVLDNAIIEKLGEDKRYTVVRAGKRFNVVEKHFVISPEKSGPLHIPPAIVKGRIALSGGDSQSLRKRMDETDMLNNFFNDSFFKDSFDGFFSNRSRGPSKPFSLNSQEINVEVLPVPSAFTGTAWLPAEDLIIKDSWAKKPPELKVGEPVTRSLTLRAKGLAGSQIPDMSFPKPEHIKSYPDKAKSETRTDGNTVFGIQHTEISYIPDVSGKVTIPKITVDWWDVKNKKQRTFTLPEWNLNVAPDLSYNADANKSTNTNTNTEISLDSEENITQEVNDNSNLANNPPEKYWGWKTIVALPILLLLLVFLIYHLKNKSKKQIQNPLISSPKHKRKNITILRSALLQACKNNDEQSTATKLLLYAQAYWNDDTIQSLGNLASHLAQGSEVIIELEQSLYSENSQQWTGKALTQLLEDGLQHKQKFERKLSNDLTPLYPT